MIAALAVRKGGYPHVPASASFRMQYEARERNGASRTCAYGESHFAKRNEVMRRNDADALSAKYIGGRWRPTHICRSAAGLPDAESVLDDGDDRNSGNHDEEADDSPQHVLFAFSLRAALIYAPEEFDEAVYEEEEAGSEDYLLGGQEYQILYLLKRVHSESEDSIDGTFGHALATDGR